MKKVLGLLLFGLFSVSAFAAEPVEIQFEAVITDVNKGTLEGSKDVDVSLKVPGSSLAIWAEEHSDVFFSDGKFRVVLGKESSLSPELLDEEAYFEFDIDGQSVTLNIYSVPKAGYSAIAGEALTVDWVNITNTPNISDLSGQITALQIPDEVITSDMIKEGAITNAHISGMISLDKIDGDVITTVSNGDLEAGAYTQITGLGTLESDLVLNENLVVSGDVLATDVTNGFVGVGTSAPQATLDVDGTLRVSDVSEISENNQVLTLDANGQLSVLDTSEWVKDASAVSYEDTNTTYDAKANGGLELDGNNEFALESIAGLPTGAQGSFTAEEAFVFPLVTVDGTGRVTALTTQEITSTNISDMLDISFVDTDTNTTYDAKANGGLELDGNNEFGLESIAGLPTGAQGSFTAEEAFVFPLVTVDGTGRVTALTTQEITSTNISDMLDISFVDTDTNTTYDAKANGGLELDGNNEFALETVSGLPSGAQGSLTAGEAFEFPVVTVDTTGRLSAVSTQNVTSANVWAMVSDLAAAADVDTDTNTTYDAKANGGLELDGNNEFALESIAGLPTGAQGSFTAEEAFVFPLVTVDGTGRVTALTTQEITSTNISDMIDLNFVDTDTNTTYDAKANGGLELDGNNEFALETVSGLPSGAQGSLTAGEAFEFPVITVDTTGRLSAVSTQNVTSANVWAMVSDLAAAADVDTDTNTTYDAKDNGGLELDGNNEFALETVSGLPSGAQGSLTAGEAFEFPVITVDTTGRLSAVSTQNVTSANVWAMVSDLAAAADSDTNTTYDAKENGGLTLDENNEFSLSGFIDQTTTVNFGHKISFENTSGGTAGSITVHNGDLYFESETEVRAYSEDRISWVGQDVRVEGDEELDLWSYGALRIQSESNGKFERSYVELWADDSNVWVENGFVDIITTGNINLKATENITLAATNNISLVTDRVSINITDSGVSMNASVDDSGTGTFYFESTTPSTTTPNNDVLDNYGMLVKNTRKLGNILALQTRRDDVAEEMAFISFFDNQEDLLGSIKGNNSGGIVFDTSGGDYAEYLPRANKIEAIEGGHIVGVKNGKISKNLSGAQKIMVVSDVPAVIGNRPEDGSIADYETVAFIGQVPVVVEGKVNVGDYIIPNGENNGVGLAVSEADLTADQASQIVGQAWEASSDNGVKRVNVAILPHNATNALLKKVQQENNELKEEIRQIREMLENLKK